MSREAQKTVKIKEKEGIIEILSSDEEDSSPGQVSGKSVPPEPTSLSHSSPETSPTSPIAKSAAKVPSNEFSPPLEFPSTTPSPPTFNDIEMEDAFEFPPPEDLDPQEGSGPTLLPPPKPAVEDKQSPDTPQVKGPIQSTALPLMSKATPSPPKTSINPPIAPICSPTNSFASPGSKDVQSPGLVQAGNSGTQNTPRGSPAKASASVTPTSSFREWGPSQADKGPFKNLYKSLDLSRRSQKEISISEKPVNLPSQTIQSGRNSIVDGTLAQTSAQPIAPDTTSPATSGRPTHVNQSSEGSILPERTTVDIPSQSAQPSQNVPVHEQPAPTPKPSTQAPTSESAGMSISKSTSSIRPLPAVPRRKVEPPSLPALPTPLYRKDGKTLSDVIKEAYQKPPPEIVDLTLDDSDDSDDSEAPELLNTLQQSADNLWRLLEKEDSDPQPPQQCKPFTRITEILY